MTTSLVHPKTAPFSAEGNVCIEPDNYLRRTWHATFVGLKPLVEGQPREALPHLRFTGAQVEYLEAQHVGALADFVAQCEAEGAVPGFEIPSENAGLQPFDYLSADENSRRTWRTSKQSRHNHAWAVYELKGTYYLWFEHGKLGYRRQTFATLSEGLRGLQALLDGSPWEHFGDDESQRTLLHKGQFYWDTARKKHPIPVDNFFFDTKDGHRFRIASCGSQSIVTWRYKQFYAYRWNEDHGQSLDQLVDILAGNTTPEMFHAHDVDEDGDGWQPARVPALPLPAVGKIHVQDIFRSSDQYLVTSLLYKTRQGHRVRLENSNTKLVLTATNLDGKKVVTPFEVDDIVGAFRLLARTLRGDAWA